MRKEHKLKVYEELLRQIFGGSRVKVIGEWSTLHNEELPYLYRSLSSVTFLELWKLQWAGPVASMGQTGNSCRILIGASLEMRPLGRPRRRCKTCLILYCIIRKQTVKIKTGLNWSILHPVVGHCARTSDN
jgi:hypothetical protein